LIPRTSSLGILLASSFWGGAICIHMAHGEPYLFQVAMLLLSWAGACLRNPTTLSSLSGPSGLTRKVQPEPAVPCRVDQCCPVEAASTPVQRGGS
jgi:hypothetical protein